LPRSSTFFDLCTMISRHFFPYSSVSYSRSHDLPCTLFIPSHSPSLSPYFCRCSFLHSSFIFSLTLPPSFLSSLPLSLSLPMYHCREQRRRGRTLSTLKERKRGKQHTKNGSDSPERINIFQRYVPPYVLISEENSTLL
jgi:hypothetical protein